MFWKKKKKIKNELLVSLHYLNRNQLDIDLDDLIIPTKKELPPYWKALTKGKIDLTELAKFEIAQHLHQTGRSNRKGSPFKKLSNGMSFSNAKSCPSFIDIFKNSYLLKAPCDILISSSEDKGVNILPMEKYLMRTQFHSMKKQFWGDFDDNILNCKFTGGWLIKTTQTPTKIMFLDPMYWGHVPYRVMPGVITVLPNHEVSLNLNVVFDRRYFGGKDYNKIIKTGTPLALLYMPDGALNIRREDFLMKGRTYFQSDYINWMNRNKK